VVVPSGNLVPFAVTPQKKKVFLEAVVCSARPLKGTKSLFGMPVISFILNP
jgi:hypothetical protein